MLLIRDLSEMAAEGPTFVSLVLEAETGMARGVAIGQTASEARISAMTSAVTTPIPPFTNTPVPNQVLCAAGQGAGVTTDLAAVLGGGPMPPVREVALPPEAEGIFDELVGHLSGRNLPDDLPTAGDWDVLVAQTLAYAQEQPWQLWPDDLLFKATVTIDGGSASYVVSVIGREGLQAGLVLYPGRHPSDVVIPSDDWQPEDPLPFREGSLLLHLNPPDDTLADMAAKALRYGWPPDARLMPVWLNAGPDGFGELSRTDAQRMALAIAGVLARHLRPTGPKGRRTSRTTGSIPLAGEVEGRYTVTDLF